MEWQERRQKTRKIKFPIFKDMIVFEDEKIIVINKAPHLSTLHERDMSRKSVLQLAELSGRDISPVHRLDKETSGILLCAKDKESYRHLALQFEKRTVQKKYHAVVQGIHEFDETLIDQPILVSPKGSVKIDRSRGKSSQTSVSTLESFRHYSLLECSPLTGRMHQIRIHLSSLGAPIAMDETYGGSIPLLSRIKSNFNYPAWEEESPMIRRVALHAHSLEFDHPEGKAVRFETDYPKDFGVFLKLLRKYDS